MWSQFFLAICIGACLLYVPGYLLLRAIGLDRLVALGVAPAISLVGYEVCAVALWKLGIWANWASVSLPVLLVAVLGYVVGSLATRMWKRQRRRRGRRRRTRMIAMSRRSQLISLAAFVVFSLGVVMVLFVKGLDGPASYFQAYDNLSHMGRIKVYVESGWFAPMGKSLYYDLGEASPMLTRTSPFYPAAWHCVAAMIVSLLDVPIALSENVVNFLFMGLVYPIGSCLLACVLFFRHERIVPMLCVFCLAFAAYPWGVLNFGPLYPNLAGYALVPATVACFLLLCRQAAPALAEGTYEDDATEKQGESHGSRSQSSSHHDGGSLGTSRTIGLAGALLVSVVGVSITHPNALFTFCVFVAPLVVQTAYCASGRFAFFQASKVKRVLLAILVAALIIFVWNQLYNAPMFAKVVGFKDWLAFASKRQAFANLLLFSLRSTPAQPVLALFVYAGVLYTMRHREHLWLTVTFAIGAWMYLANASTDEFWKNFLTGFWYGDSYRVCAMLALFALPLAGMGMIAFVRFFDMVRRKLCEGLARPISERFAHGVLLVLVTLCMCYPTFEIFGLGEVETAFGYLEWANFHVNDTSRLDDVYNADEREFVQEVKEIVPEGALILNQPYDGSAFAYANDDLNVYYRYLGTYNGLKHESMDGWIIRNRLNFIADNDKVRDAVAETGAQYVLILDAGDRDDEENRDWLISYNPQDWCGFNRIYKDTPGFELVISKGDMRLYRITAL